MLRAERSGSADVVESGLRYGAVSEGDPGISHTQ